MIDSPLDLYLTWRTDPSGDTWATSQARRVIFHLACLALFGPAVGLHLVFGVPVLEGMLVGAPLAYAFDHALSYQLYKRVLAARRRRVYP